MKKILLPLLLVFCFFFNSCSRLDLAVQFANTYVTNKADDYFDLTREQIKWLRENFEKDFLRVQRTIFPQIASEMVRASDIINTNRPVDTTTVMITYERVKNLFYDGLRMFSGSSVLFADKLRPNQVTYFQKEFDKKMNDLREDENSKESYKKMKKHFNSWLGSLTAMQKNEMEDFSKVNPPVTIEKIYNRQQLAHEFTSSFPDKENRKRFIIKLTTQFDQVYEGKFSKSAKDRNNGIIALVTSILNKMTDDQRQTLVQTLRDRANQLIKISKN